MMDHRVSEMIRRWTADPNEFNQIHKMLWDESTNHAPWNHPSDWDQNESNLAVGTALRLVNRFATDNGIRVRNVESHASWDVVSRTLNIPMGHKPNPYVATACLHELAHSTLLRLPRVNMLRMGNYSGGGAFNGLHSPDYCNEEVVAETVAHRLVVELGLFTGNLDENHLMKTAAYIVQYRNYWKNITRSVERQAEEFRRDMGLDGMDGGDFGLMMINMIMKARIDMDISFARENQTRQSDLAQHNEQNIQDAVDLILNYA